MRLIVLGAGGRMGRMLIRAVAETDGAQLHAAIERPSSVNLGADSGQLASLAANGIIVTDSLEYALEGADGILDFTAPAATRHAAALAAQKNLVHIVGTTGLEPDDHALLDSFRSNLRLVQSGNMSVGVNLLAELVRTAASKLQADFDIEIIEMHHKHKVDSPSGTAWMLAKAAADGRNIALETHVLNRDHGLIGARPKGGIGMQALRGGSVIGDHTVVFAGEGERVEITHKADDRLIFARGAVRAALWAWTQSPGRYTMKDVLQSQVAAVFS
jgi:4-hydroxy-tetrahydrodipicolinate reductase